MFDLAHDVEPSDELIRKAAEFSQAPGNLAYRLESRFHPGEGSRFGDIKGTANVTIPDSIMNSQQTEQFSWIIVGVALMLLVIFRPQGILGNKRELRFDV